MAAAARHTGARPSATMPFGEAEVHHGSLACHAIAQCCLLLLQRVLRSLLAGFFYVISANENQLDYMCAFAGWLPWTGFTVYSYY